MDTALSTVLSEQQIAQFEQDGYLVFRKLLEPAACEHMLALSLIHI